MESIFTFLIKLLTIFIGSGFVSLLAFYIGKEITEIPKLIVIPKKEREKSESEKIILGKYKKISEQSGIYEVLFPDNKTVKLFSSQEGIKVLNT